MKDPTYKSQTQFDINSPRYFQAGNINNKMF